MYVVKWKSERYWPADLGYSLFIAPSDRKVLGLHRRLLRLFVSRINADRQRCVCGCLVAKVCFPISVAFSCFTAKIGRTISILNTVRQPRNVETPSNVLVFSERSGVSFSFFAYFFASFTMVIERPASRSRTVHRCIVCPWRNASQAHAESASVPGRYM